jgi:glycerol 2-dehydrogenase (NADP+)
MSPVLTDPLVKRLAEKYSKPAGTVLLSWLIQRGNWTAVPKTATESRMKDNLAIFELDKEDFEALSKVHQEEGKLLHLCDYGQGDIAKTRKIFGWSLEDMGWDHLD